MKRVASATVGGVAACLAACAGSASGRIALASATTMVRVRMLSRGVVRKRAMRAGVDSGGAGVDVGRASRPIPSCRAPLPLTPMSLASRFSLRSAPPDDVPVILSCIRGLAEYEKLAHQVVATEDRLRETLFGPRPAAEVIL